MDKKLQELQDLDIIEDVEGPTPWVSPSVAVLLSRLPIENQPFRKGTLRKNTLITSQLMPSQKLTLEEICSATKADPILQQVQCCLNGAEWPDIPDLKP